MFTSLPNLSEWNQYLPSQVANSVKPHLPYQTKEYVMDHGISLTRQLINAGLKPQLSTQVISELISCLPSVPRPVAW
jgi:hypothetical protein